MAWWGWALFAWAMTASVGAACLGFVLTLRTSTLNRLLARDGLMELFEAAVGDEARP